MAYEIERLTAVFDSEERPAAQAFARMEKRVKSYAAALKQIKTDFSFKMPSYSGNVRELTQIVRLQGEQARTERLIETAKQATLKTERESLRLEQQKNRLQSQNPKTSRTGLTGVDSEMRSALADIERMKTATLNGNRAIANSEKELTNIVIRESNQRTAAETRNAKKAANELIADIGKVEKSQKKRSSTSSGNSGASSLISGKTAAFAGLVGGAVAIGASQIGSELVQLTKEGKDAYLSLDKLTRFTATLDKNFQSPAGLKQLRTDITKLSLEVPQTAEDIAKASFVLKSAYQNMTEPELIDFLRDFAVAATGSNTTIDQHTEKVAALASQYGVTKKELGEFNALIASSLGQALAKDDEVLSGLNRLIVPARAAKVSLSDLMAAMSTMQSVSSDAAENTTMLKDAMEKLGDGKYIERLKAVFNIDRFDAAGGIKPLNTIVNELSAAMSKLPTDAEKYAKLNEVFKDVRARNGIQALIQNIDKYNASLKEGGNQETFLNKNNTMLNSAEARWAKFDNYISSIQRDAGGKLSDVLTAGITEESTGSNISNFFLSLGKQIFDGGKYVQNIAKNAAVTLQEDMFGYDETKGGHSPTFYANLRQQNNDDAEKYYAENEKNLQKIIQNDRDTSRKYYESIANDTAAPAAVKEAAKKSLAVIISNMQADFAGAADENFKNWKKIGDEAVKGLQSSDPAIQNQAKLTVDNLNQQLTKALGDPKYSDGMKNQIRQLWTSLPAISAEEIAAGKPAINQAVSDLTNVEATGGKESGQRVAMTIMEGLQAGIQDRKPQVQQAEKDAVQPDYASYQIIGVSLGGNFGDGVVQGILNCYARVRAAAANLMHGGVEAAAQAQDSHSPSRRTAKEIGIPFVQGIEVGVMSRASNLAGSVKNMIEGAMNAAGQATNKTIKGGAAKPNKPKIKSKTDDQIKEFISDLETDSSRIDSAQSRSEAATKRFYDAILGDRTAGEDAELARQRTYYQALEDAENNSYDQRIANIAAREDQINRLKKIKPQERARELAKLADERTATDEDHTAKTFDLKNDKGGANFDAAMRNIEKQKQIFARELKIGALDRIGNKNSAAANVELDFADKFRALGQEKTLLESNRAKFAVGSKERIELENKIAEKVQERADLEVEKSGEVIRAREDDKRSAADYARSLVEFNSQTIDAETEAERAKLDLLQASGAKKEVVLKAQFDLAVKEEAIQHNRRVAEIEASRKSLLDLAQTDAQKLQIQKDYNAQMEAEDSRHNSAVGSATAANTPKTIKQRLDEAVAQLPSYKQQFSDFAVSIPESFGSAFASGIQSWDGTFKGFLSTIKNAFAQTIQEMVAELLRSQLVKLISSLVGSLVGGLAGGAIGGGGKTAVHESFHIGAHADGGIPDVGRLSLVGERGPELFVPQTRGRILTNSDTKQLLGGNSGGGGAINNVTINQNFRESRGLTAPKSVKQSSEAALKGASRGLRNSR